jgi:glycosyltransferase involved in cell wall biosynthesis
LRQRYKGFEFVLKALKKLPVDLYVITFGLETFSKDEIPQDFKHFGEVHYDVLNELYNLSDVFLSPSINEAMGKTFVESQFCGTPVVAFKNTGPESVIAHEESGYLARYLSVDDLVYGVKYCLNRSWDRNSIRDSALNKFEISSVAKKYIKVYEKCLLDWSNS